MKIYFLRTEEVYVGSRCYSQSFPERCATPAPAALVRRPFFVTDQLHLCLLSALLPARPRSAFLIRPLTNCCRMNRRASSPPSLPPSKIQAKSELSSWSLNGRGRKSTHGARRGAGPLSSRTRSRSLRVSLLLGVGGGGG